LLNARLLDTRFFSARLLDMLCRSGLGYRFAMVLRLCLGFALHLQPVFFQLLSVNRLLRAMVLLRLLRPALSTVGTIATIAAATATAAAIAPPTARLFALRPRRTIGILRTRTRTLLHGWPRLLLLLLLLRTGLALLIGPPLTLGTIGLRTILPAVRALCRRLLALLRSIGLRPFSVRAVRAGLLLLRGALVAPGLLVAPCIAIATLLLVRTAATAVALLVTCAVATSAASISSAAPAAPTTLAAAMLVPVARLVPRAFRTLRPCRTHRRFVGS
jgi:hypothetical protein